MILVITLLSIILVGTGLHGNEDGYNGTLNMPMGVFMHEGMLHVIDTNNNVIRKVKEGYIITLNDWVEERDDFGRLIGGYRNGSIETALFNRPTSAVVDSRGRVFVTDTGNNAIRKIENGVVTTFVYGLNAPTGIYIDVNDDLYVADTLSHTIIRIDAEGNVEIIAGVYGEYGYVNGNVNEARFNYPMGIALDENGVIFVADTNNHLIRVITEDGYVRTLAGQVLLDEDEDYCYYESYPLGAFADGYNALFNFPVAIALYASRAFVADSGNHRVRGIDINTGYTYTLAGTGYPDYFHLPSGIYVSSGYILVVDTGNNQIKSISLEMLNKEVYSNEGE